MGCLCGQKSRSCHPKIPKTALMGDPSMILSFDCEEFLRVTLSATKLRRIRFCGNGRPNFPSLTVRKFRIIGYTRTGRSGNFSKCNVGCMRNFKVGDGGFRKPLSIAYWVLVPPTRNLGCSMAGPVKIQVNLQRILYVSFRGRAPL